MHAFERALRARTLCEAFQITAAARADQVALRTVDGGVSLTFGALSERVRRLTAGLAALGVRPGDTVGHHAHEPAGVSHRRPGRHAPGRPAVLHLQHLGTQSDRISLRDAANKIVITERAFVDRLVAVRDGGIRSSMIVVVDGAPEGMLSLEDVEAAGDADFDFDATWSAVGPDDVLTSSTRRAPQAHPRVWNSLTTT